MDFQSQVYYDLPPAVEGDFASSNPRANVLAGQGALVAGANGVIVGRFAWASASGVVSSTGTGAPTGFVHREQQALITAFLASTSMAVPQGFPVTLHSAGDFWVKNAGTAAATIGQKVFTKNADGSCISGEAGATIANYTETKWYVASAAAAGELMKMSSYPLG